MSDEENYVVERVVPALQDQKSRSQSKEIWKKWVRTKDSGRFCKLELWEDKVIIDMGTTDGAGKLNNNTKLYTDTIELYTYLEAVKLGTAKYMYPSDSPSKDKSAFDVFTSYGGGRPDGQAVSRILKIQSDEESRQGYYWKNGIFVAKESSTGAFIPDYSKQISVSSIKFTRLEMANIANTILFEIGARV